MAVALSGRAVRRSGVVLGRQGRSLRPRVEPQLPETGRRRMDRVMFRASCDESWVR
jgi:hypothetical protein